jgi:predicted RND superfamily exporter protein
MTSSLADLVRFVRQVFDPESGGALPDDAPTLAQLIFLGSSPAFERFADRSYARTVLWAYLRTDASDVMRALLDRTRRYAAEHPLGDLATVHIAGGTGPTLFALNEHTTHGKVVNISMILLVVLLSAAVILRSLVGGLFVVLPLAFTLVVNLGILGWGGFSLDLVTTTIVTIGVGVGADYAMYLLYRIREEASAGSDFNAALRRALTTSGRAVVFVAVAIGTGFAVLAPARHISWRLTGILLPVTMLVSCIAAVTLVPVLVAAIRPRFIFSHLAKLGGRAAAAQEHARA